MLSPYCKSILVVTNPSDKFDHYHHFGAFLANILQNSLDFLNYCIIRSLGLYSTLWIYCTVQTTVLIKALNSPRLCHENILVNSLALISAHVYVYTVYSVSPELCGTISKKQHVCIRLLMNYFYPFKKDSTQTK